MPARKRPPENNAIINKTPPFGLPDNMQAGKFVYS